MAIRTAFERFAAIEADAEPYRVLVVDDYPEMRKLLQVVLRHQNVQVEACAGGQEALTRVTAWTPDLIMLDIMMPGLDGYQILEILRSQPETAEIPVIMLSALGETVDVVRGLHLGANDYLTKPFKETELIARVETQLKVKRLQDQRREDVARLRELDALKDRFITIASHDLKGPLGTIASAASVLESQVLDGDLESAGALQIAETIQSCTQTMQSIIDDFLNLQVIRSGAVSLDRQMISLNTLAGAMVEQYQLEASQKDITLEADLDSDMPDCSGDPDRLVQVLNNLVSNAIKYSPSGAHVIVRTRAGDWLRVEVEDNGPGILEEEMPLLFHEFTRLRNTPTNGEPSSGVGLSIIRRLVEMHGGRVGAQSTPDVGSIFWFELPRDSE